VRSLDNLLICAVLSLDENDFFRLFQWNFPCNRPIGLSLADDADDADIRLLVSLADDADDADSRAFLALADDADDTDIRLMVSLADDADDADSRAFLSLADDADDTDPDGTTQQSHICVRNDNDNHVWMADGGL